MFLLSVATINKGVFKEGLSYFSKEPVLPGALVATPVRNSQQLGLVTEVTEVKDNKNSIKRADFSLKKISRVVAPTFYSPAYIEAFNKSADYFATTVGQTIRQFLPKSVISDQAIFTDLPDSLPIAKNLATFAPQTLHGADKFILQEPRPTRYENYKNLARESLARKESVMIIVPEISNLNNLVSFIGKGISEYVFTLHGKQKPSLQIDTWRRAAASGKPVILIGTKQIMSIPRFDLGLIIIDEEASNSHVSIDRPYIDTRVTAEFLAETTKAKFILGDSLIRVRTYTRLQQKHFSSLSRLKNITPDGPGVTIVSPLSDPNIGKKIQPLIGPDFARLLKYARHKNERVIVFTHQKGLHPLTICGDCSAVVSCPTCHKPLILHRRDLANSFVCHTCGYHIPAFDQCPACLGFRLNLVGGGSTLFYQTIVDKVGAENVFLLDKETSKTDSAATKIANQFYDAPNGIIITTEFGLNYLAIKTPYVVVASIDSLLTIPNYEIYEKAARILTTAIQLSSQHVLIQTKLPDLTLFDQFTKGSITDFFESELNDRKLLGYPPFTVIVKVSASESTKNTGILNQLTENTHAYQPRLVRKVVGAKTPITSLILKVPTPLWPDRPLIDLLRQLPPTFTIIIDPETIL